MNAETVGIFLGDWVERLVDLVCLTVEGKRAKHGFPFANLCLDRQVVPAVARWPLTRNVCR